MVHPCLRDFKAQDHRNVIFRAVTRCNKNDIPMVLRGTKSRVHSCSKPCCRTCSIVVTTLRWILESVSHELVAVWLNYIRLFAYIHSWLFLWTSLWRSNATFVYFTPSNSGPTKHFERKHEVLHIHSKVSNSKHVCLGIKTKLVAVGESEKGKTWLAENAVFSQKNCWKMCHNYRVFKK